MINKAILMGRVGKKDYKQIKNGTFLCQLSIATNRKYLDSHNHQIEITTWHNVNFFNKLAEIANKYANVGDLIYIEGEISNKKKIDENGITHMFHSILGNEMKFIPTGRKDNLPAKLEPSNEENSTIHRELCDMHDDSSIPF